MATDPIWVAKSPVPDFPEIRLDRERWQTHVITNHPEMDGREGNALTAVTTPTHVVAGNKVAAYAVFINQNDTRSNGHPIVVVVNKFSGSVVTALYHRKYVSVKPEEVIWQST